MNIEIKNQMVWGFRYATIRELFSPKERFETNQLIRGLKILLSQAGEYGCFTEKAQTNTISSQQKMGVNMK
jgi:hypothetical protein